MILYTHKATGMTYKKVGDDYYFKTGRRNIVGKPPWIMSGMEFGFVEVEAEIPGDLEAYFNIKHIKHLEADIVSYQADIAGLEAALLAITKELKESHRTFDILKKGTNIRARKFSERIFRLNGQVGRLRAQVPPNRTEVAREMIKMAKLTAKPREGARICNEIAEDLCLSWATVYNIWVREK